MTIGLAHRRLDGEILDGLPPDDPRAVRSRADLARINGLMFHPAIMASLLRAHLAAPPRRLLDIGGGDGRFALAVARRLSRRWPGVGVTLIDRTDCVAARTRDAFAGLGWRLDIIEADLFDGLAASPAPFDAVMANLILHHFTDADLARLFAAIAPFAPVFVAAEPRRAVFPLAASSLVGAVGANDVTRHDAPASIRAGFRDGELTPLWPPASGAALNEGPRGLFTHAFAAVRR